MRRRAFTLLELLVTLAVSSVFIILLMQADTMKYKLLKIKDNQPAYNTVDLINQMQKDFSNYKLQRIVNADTYFMELKQNNICSVFWNFDKDSETLERYVSCNWGNCESDCQDIHFLVKDLKLQKENKNIISAKVQQIDKNYMQTFKIYKKNFILY
jgi:prepilin-type N-terminal cleavage/methylation domain-containing protein